MKVLIADDHAVVRRGLAQILSDTYEELVTGEATNAEEALEMIRKERWDIVILDISMPGRSGLDALKEIKTQNPGLPVLILSIHPEDQFATRVLKAGASGYLTKETAPEELVSAIEKAMAGGKYVSSALAEKLAEDLKLNANHIPLHKKLSDREYEVLLLIASGNSISEIAERFSLSVKTISTYRSRILEKTHMKSNADLVRYAITHGLID
jgi:two-component system invasion response regulator UvrY